MGKFFRAPLTVLSTAVICSMLLLCNFTQMLSLLLLPFSSRGFRAVNRFCAATWFNSLTWVLENVVGVEFVCTGDELPNHENAFVIANHQSGADIPALIAVASRAGRTGDLKWFVKDVIKWLPGVGWGMLFLDCLFVKRNWSADKEKILATFGRLRKHQVEFWILSFVEGTRLKPAKLLRSQEFERKAGLSVLHHVMSPRTKGFEATLEGLGSMVQAVYDFTIAYEGFPTGNVPGVKALFFGPMRRVHLHVKRTPAAELPSTREARVQWVLDAFEAKDKRLAEFYRSGKLLSPP